MTSNTIFLDRAYMPFGTFGVMNMPSGKTFYTVEKPDKGNRDNESCIPEGTYELGLRESSVISRTTHGKYSEGWNVKDVPDRDYIMIHIANTVNDLEGCIGLGKGVGFIENNWAVTSSSTAFDEFMAEMKDIENPKIVIQVKRMEYP